MKEGGGGVWIRGHDGDGGMMVGLVVVMEIGQQICPWAASLLAFILRLRNKQPVVALEEKLRCQAGTDGQAPSLC